MNAERRLGFWEEAFRAAYIELLEQHHEDREARAAVMADAATAEWDKRHAKDWKHIPYDELHPILRQHLPDGVGIDLEMETVLPWPPEMRECTAPIDDGSRQCRKPGYLCAPGYRCEIHPPSGHARRAKA